MHTLGAEELVNEGLAHPVAPDRRSVRRHPTSRTSVCRRRDGGFDRALNARRYFPAGARRTEYQRDLASEPPLSDSARARLEKGTAVLPGFLC